MLAVEEVHAKRRRVEVDVTGAGPDVGESGINHPFIVRLMSRGGSVVLEIRYRVWGGQNKPDVWRTEAELEKRWDWRLLHPEVRRRHLALYRLSDHRIGFLSGARSAAQQAALYAERGPGGGAAPPGLSFHEDDSYADFGQLWAVAVDNIGDMRLIVELAPEVGLYTLVASSPSEPWHTQPAELPRSRRTFKIDPGRYRIGVWPLDGPHPNPPAPTTPPIVEDDDMAKTIFIGVEGQAGQYIWTPGSEPIAFTDPHQRDLILGALGIGLDGVTISPEMFSRLH